MIALVLLAIPPIVQVRYAWLLFRQVPSNANVVNPITATAIVLMAATIVIVVVYRIVGLMRGTFRLEYASTSGWLCWLRIFSLVLLYGGVLVIAGSVVARFVTGISAALLIADEFRNLIPVGLLLFESSRLMEREILVARSAS